MPELPDVEGFRATLAREAVGRRVRDVAVHDASVLLDTSGRAFRGAVRGRRFAEPRRHGKWLLAPIEDARTANPPVVVFHFGMTGGLVWSAGSEERHRYDRVVFEFGGGELRYRDMRKLKGLRLTTEDGVADLLADLGPDAANLSRPDLTDLLCGRHRQLKAALMDQEVVAGLGNLLADEVLWQACLHPRRHTDDLTDAELRALHGRLRSTVRSASKVGRVPDRPSWLTGSRDHERGTCPRCGTRLTHGRAGGRTTVWCPRCQPSP
ncbi:MAG: Fpg/Nei family DNA glycosylase [Streptosporangiales bacterium]